MRSLASPQHTQRDERQKRYADRAENELDGKHRGILADMTLTFSRRVPVVRLLAHRPRRRERAARGGLGFTCGMAYSSFFGQLIRIDQPDPFGVPAAWVVGSKGVGILLAIVALAGSLRHPQQKSL